MWFLRLQTGDKQLPLCFTFNCNQNFGQGQEWQRLNGSSSYRETNAWACCQMHDNDSITALFAMNVISRASNWGQLSFCLTLGSKCNSWQGQEWKLLNRFLSCSATNSCVSDQMHDNDSITEHFPMNVIPKAWNWGQGTATLHHLGVESKSLTRTSDLTTAQWVFIMQTYKYLCVLSDAWQWFHNRAFYNECDSLCFKLGTTANSLYHGTKLPIVTRTGMTAAQPLFVLQ